MATSLHSKGLAAVADKIIIAARPALELVKLFTTDFSDTAAKQYDTIKVNVLKAVANSFTKGTYNYVKGGNTISFANVMLSNDKISTFVLDDLSALEDDLAPIWNKLGPVAGRAVAKAFITSVAGLLGYAAADAQVTGLTLSTFAAFVNLRANVEANNYDPSDCVLILEPTTYNTLVGLLPSSVVGEGGVVNSALIGARLGFKSIIEGPNISKASTASANKGLGFVVPTDAIAIAGRYKAPIAGEGGETIEAGVATDDETGLPIGIRVVRNSADGEIGFSGEALFGAALAKQTHTIGGVSTPNNAPGYLQLVSA